MHGFRQAMSYLSMYRPRSLCHQAMICRFISIASVGVSIACTARSAGSAFIFSEASIICIARRLNDYKSETNLKS